jgi:4-hydroxy-3-methylbut-2-enyl diphosphate reductase
MSPRAGMQATRKVLLASPRSFCAGVERAIQTVLDVLGHYGPPVYVRKQIVHNTHVVQDLTSKGAIFVDELAEVPDGAVVVFSAHGVAPAVVEEAEARGLEVIDATCPLVSKVHAEARRFARRGSTVLLIGHANHEETQGTYGEAPESIRVIETAQDAATVEVPDPRRVSYLTQTTLAVDEATTVVHALRERFPALEGPPDDDICYATTNRQLAVRDIAEQSEVILVVGSENSSNSVRLVEVARREGTPAWLIEDASQLRAEWLHGVTTVGLTAGASAPPELVDGVIDALREHGPVQVEERRTVPESVYFAPPRLTRDRSARDRREVASKKGEIP